MSRCRAKYNPMKLSLLRRASCLAGIAYVLSGCGVEATPLAELGPTRVSIGAGLFSNSIVDVTLEPLGGECPTIDAGATAALNGIPMSLVGSGGLHEVYEQGEGCYHPNFQLTVNWEDVLQNSMVGRAETSTIVVEDSSATWTIAVDGLLVADIRMIGTPTTGGRVLLDWPQQGSSTCSSRPCWRPGVGFSNLDGKLLNSWVDSWLDPSVPSFFTPKGSDWEFTIKWDGGSSTMPSPGRTSGFLIIQGQSSGYPSEPSGTVRRCDGPAECQVSQVESVSTYPATLF